MINIYKLIIKALKNKSILKLEGEKMKKNIYDIAEIEELIKNFDKKQVEQIDICTKEMISINFNNPVIEMDSTKTGFNIFQKVDDKYISSVLSLHFSEIEKARIEKNERTKITTITITFSKGTIVEIHYK